MEKIISLFKRDYEGTRQIYEEIVPGAEWVLAGEGVATEKFDGTACLVKDGVLYKRYDAKRGKPPPAGFIPAQDPDPATGHWPGWVTVGDGPEDQWHRAAWATINHDGAGPPDGTYELVGPKVQGNPYSRATHILVRHGAVELRVAAASFAAIRGYLSQHEIEGIVWHHPDGRMVKIKRRDFGLPWPPKA